MITGGAGSGKSTLAAERIKAAAEAGKSVLACIPEQFSFEYDRTMYGKLGAALYNSIETAGFLRIANDIFIKYGGSSGKSADDLTKTVLMHRTIMRLSAEKAFVCFGRQAGTKTFAKLLFFTAASAARKISLSPSFRPHSASADVYSE